jgi:hypothetical protein
LFAVLGWEPTRENLMSRMCAVLALTSSVALVFTHSPANASYLDPHKSIHHYSFKVGHLRYRVTDSHRGKQHAHRVATARSLSLAGVTPVLAAKARQIVSACGSTIISTISARGHRSNHPIGRAVDMRGNPSCIYAHLKGWPGGYSTDYRAVQHVHISYNPGGQEWGLHFAHGGRHYHRATRYAGGPAMRSYARLSRESSGQTLMLYVGKSHQPL